VRTPALFIFAHHDDEFFIAATMRRLAAAHRPLSAAWLTRGGLNGERREAESRRAMQLIGVPASNQFFFRLPDGHALDFLEEIAGRLERLIIKLRSASIFVPAWEGGHPDHDTVQLAAAIALRRLASDAETSAQNESLPVAESPSFAESPPVATSPPALYEFPLYSRGGARLLNVGRFIPANSQKDSGGRTPAIQPTPSEIKLTPMKLKDRLFKRKLAANFRSQRAVIWPLTGLRGGPMMVHLKGEPYSEVPPGRDYTKRPHPGRLFYEYYTATRFRDFAAAAKVLS